MRAPLIAITSLLVFVLVFMAPLYGQQGESQEAYFVFGIPPSSDTFVIKLTDTQKIQQARNILATGGKNMIAGTIIKQPVYYNSPWTYHLDPKSIGFPEFAIELCDAGFIYREEDRDSAYPDWCPWNSVLLREIPAPAKPGTENLTPAISMRFPYGDNTYLDGSPTTVTLVANADDADGTISKVEFSNGQLIGETTTYPYSFTWQNLAPGSYTVSATATDDKGAKTTSKSVTFLITGGPPQLLTDVNSSRAAALDSVTLMKEPLPVVSEHLLSSDQRTRLILFGLNLELRLGENASAITAQAEDSQQKTYVLPVEGVSRVHQFPWLTQVTVNLPDELQGIGEVWLSVSLRGVRSNKVPFKIR